MSSVLLVDLIAEVTSGDWGEAEPADDTDECIVLRGTDFQRLAQGDVSAAPHRFLKRPSILKRRLVPNDLLVEMSGGSEAQPTGRIARITDTLIDLSMPVTFSNFVKRVRVSENADASYFALAWDLLYRQGRTRPYEKRTTGIRNFRINDFLSSETIPLPSLEDQRRIARILATISRARDARQALALQTRRLKSSLQEALFRDTDPACLVEVGKLGRVVTGRTPSTTIAEYYGGDIPFIGPGDIDNDTEVIRAAKTLSELGLVKANAIPHGAVLTVCIGATIGKVGRTGTERAATNQQINSLIVEEDVIDSRYAHRAIEYFGQDLPNHASRAAIPIVNKSNFARMQIPVPSMADQRKTARALDAVAHYREATLKEAEALDQLFGAAMYLLIEQAS